MKAVHGLFPACQHAFGHAGYSDWSLSPVANSLLDKTVIQTHSSASEFLD